MVFIVFRSLIDLNICLISALKRCKSTPGLVESSGKVPLESMFVPRYYTMPNANTTQSSRGSNGSHGSFHDDVSISDHSNHASQHSADETRDSVDGGAHARHERSADMTNSMTVSSITSYITDQSSAQKSPLVPDLPRPASSPPVAFPLAVSGVSDPNQQHWSPTHMAPALQSYLSRSHGDKINLFGASRDDLSGGSSLHAGHPGHHRHHHRRTSQQDATSTHPLIQLTGSSPTSASLPPPVHLDPSNAFPTPALSPASNAPTASCSPALLDKHSHAGGRADEPQTELLYQEITRLRERLQMLESENASMSLKLNQQQWDVENRLAEIEMHICGSESAGSGSEDRSMGNKESVI